MIRIKFKNIDILNEIRNNFPGKFSNELYQELDHYDSKIFDFIEKFSFFYNAMDKNTGDMAFLTNDSNLINIYMNQVYLNKIKGDGDFKNINFDVINFIDNFNQKHISNNQLEKIDLELLKFIDNIKSIGVSKDIVIESCCGCDDGIFNRIICK